MAKKGCELCDKAARMFCESDQASLCWECDEKVHAANFLVAKHSRTLLCHVCRAPTPWKAAGLKLGPTVSVCHACAVDGENRDASSSRREGSEDGYDSRESETDSGEIYSDDSDEDEEEEEEEEEEEMEEEDGENQVVPWSAASFDSAPPAAATSSSGSEENVSPSSSKRSRDYPFESSEDEDGCCSSHNMGYSKSAPSDSTVEESSEIHVSSPRLFRPLKLRRGSSETGPTPPCSEGTAAIVEKLRRFQQDIVEEGGADASAMVLSLSKFTRE